MLNGRPQADAANNESSPSGMQTRRAAPDLSRLLGVPAAAAALWNVFIRLAQVPRVAGSSATQDTKRGTSTATILSSPPIVWDAAREFPVPAYLAASRSCARLRQTTAHKVESLQVAYLSRSSSRTRTRIRTNANAPHHGRLGVQNVEGGGALRARLARRQALHDAASRPVDDHLEIALHTHWHGTRQDVDDSVKAARAHDVYSRGGAPGGGLGVAEWPFALVSKLRTRTRVHGTCAGVQDVDGVAILRFVRLIRMSSAFPVPPDSEGRMRTYRHGPWSLLPYLLSCNVAAS
ncbi:hypothetical protein C8R45DRAFT_1110550 [Mycena sanguinolenta]|nr:hypothetical protein C8R45DRAFT_1110550 [Mycena sanguinolenta]